MDEESIDGHGSLWRRLLKLWRQQVERLLDDTEQHVDSNSEMIEMAMECMELAMEAMKPQKRRLRGAPKSVTCGYSKSPDKGLSAVRLLRMTWVYSATEMPVQESITVCDIT
jgi:hypothetical protein